MFNFFNKIDHSFIAITIFLLYNAGASSLTQSRIFLLCSFILLLFLFIYKKRNLGKFILFFIAFWVIINLLSYYNNKPANIHLLTLATRSGVLLLFYFILKVVGPDFFDKLVKYIYILTLISLPFYFIDLLNPGLFNSLSGSLNFMTQEEQKLHGGWYIFIYMHNAWAYLPGQIYRNSGFMWEPGGFSMILVFALIYHMGVNNFKWDKISFTFIFAILTTFSTSGYIAIILILIAYNQQLANKSYALYILAIPIVIYLGYYMYNLDFMGSKIDGFVENIDNSYKRFSGVIRVNRIAIMKYNFEQSLAWPFGNGLYESKYLLEKYGTVFSGSNTIANVLYIWGWPGLILMSISSYKFIKEKFRKTVVVNIVLLLAYFSVLFSNSMEFRPLIYVVLFYPFIYLKNKKQASLKIRTREQSLS